MRKTQCSELSQCTHLILNKTIWKVNFILIVICFLVILKHVSKDIFHYIRHLNIQLKSNHMTCKNLQVAELASVHHEQCYDNSAYTEQLFRRSRPVAGVFR